MIKNLKYIALGVSLMIGFIGCEDDDVGTDAPTPRPALVAGEADFSTYVALGNSLTAGFSDNALFRASQENSLPNILSQQFGLLDDQDFSQPLTNDNFGGLVIGGTRITGPRLVTTGGAPQNLEEVIGEVTLTTDLLDPPVGPFNNMGVPGAKSFHLLAPGYGNLSNFPFAANPYFVRMASTPNATVLEDALAQQPTFFSLWIGNNDVLGYALAGGDDSIDQITPLDGQPGAGFQATYQTLIGALTQGGAKGVVANIPDVTTIPHFTAVPWNPLDPENPNFGSQIEALNANFAGINLALAALGFPERAVVFNEDDASGVLIIDDSMPNISVQLAAALQAGGLDALTAGLLANQYGQARQANEDDLLVLPVSSIIAEVDEDYFALLTSFGVPPETAGQLSVNGVTLPLADKWVLTAAEQDEIAGATMMFNEVIESAANQAGLAFVDANGILERIFNKSYTGFDIEEDDDDDDDFETSTSGNFQLTSDLVTGGAFSLDGVHPTSRGYALLANEFLRAIDKAYNTNFEASGSFVDIGNYPTNYSPTLQ